MSKQRILPAWMNDTEPKECLQDKANQQKHRPVQRGKAPPKSSSEPSFLERRLPFLKFNGKINYFHNKDDCNFICQNIIESSQKPVICGFDIEWRVSYKSGEGLRTTAVAQICLSENECYIFHLSAMKGFPIAFKSLLQDKTIIKAGVGINGDMSKLRTDYKVSPAGVADLSVLLNQVKKISENWSLNGMLVHLMKLRLDKDPEIRCSNWERFHLTKKQLEYAALDAYASWLLYGEIMKLDR